LTYTCVLSGKLCFFLGRASCILFHIQTVDIKIIFLTRITRINMIPIKGDFKVLWCKCSCTHL